MLENKTGEINQINSTRLADPSIEDVATTAWSEFRKGFLKVFSISFIFALACLASAVYIFNISTKIFISGSMPLVAITFFGIVALPIAFYYASLTDKYQYEFMRQFARLNNFSYSKTSLLFSEQAWMVTLGMGKKVTNYISGTLFGKPVFLFNLSDYGGSSRSSGERYYTVCHVQVPYHVPTIVFKSFNSGVEFYFSDLIQPHTNTGRSFFIDFEKINLSGDVDNSFQLWVEKKYEIEALQIFTEQFLKRLIDDWKNIYVEIIDQNIFISIDKVIITKVELENMFSLTKDLLQHIDSMSTRLSSSTNAMRLHTEPKTKTI